MGTAPPFVDSRSPTLPELADADGASQLVSPAATLSSADDGREDWTELPQNQAETKTPQFGLDYDPRPKEDQARRHIAYLLIGLLWVVVAAVFLLISLGSIKVADIKEFAVVLGPVVTLVSAATGFYYGTKAK